MSADFDAPPLPFSIYDSGSWQGASLPGASQPVSPIATALLELDPDYARQRDMMRYFDPQLTFEFITDRRYAEQMRPQGDTTSPGLHHPRDWYPDASTAPIYTAGDDGYILYSSDPHVQWRPQTVRVTDNYLALRVRNMGDGAQVACITHVALAPAPRNRGQVNVNTAETHRIVKGITGNNWEIELFNALLGLPGVVNALNPDMDPMLPPQADDDIALPEVTVDKSLLPDPWRAPWPAPAAFVEGTLPPPLIAAPQSLWDPDVDANTVDWNQGQEGRAALRLISLLQSQRPAHTKGRWYTSLAELLSGVVVGGVHRLDKDGPWPLSNLGIAPGTPAADIDALTIIPTEERYAEILERFKRLSNLTTTRSDVFEIIVTVQSGSVADDNNDGVLDYRGDEFFPMTETRARVIYDRRARTIRMDEAREIGEN
ncbi:MAG TPA: hypothetical protein ENN29_12675 [Candidatus Hydrogenedentes bacterium]|nr:hypothetical protein [Candidatus Hydrogenedentota bacterium]